MCSFCLLCCVVLCVIMNEHFFFLFFCLHFCICICTFFVFKTIGPITGSSKWIARKGKEEWWKAFNTRKEKDEAWTG